MPDSRIIEDLMGSGELDKNLSLSGDFWVTDILAHCAGQRAARGRR